MWGRLLHPNIVPFLGVTDAPAPLSMVSEWMPNGDVRHYVRKHPEVDRLQLVRHIVSFGVFHEFLHQASSLTSVMGSKFFTSTT
jgi:serine/threonine protein kinase